MAAEGADATGLWLLTPGLFLLLLILLSIFLTALCSDCNRNSFELQDSKTEKAPSALIRVVKLEEVKENPMIGEIQKDEREFRPGGDPAEPVSSSEAQQRELQSRPDPNPSEGTSARVPLWRSHLVAPESRELNGSAPQTSDHVRDGRDNGGEALGPSANRLSTQLHYVIQSDDRNSVYARVSKKLRLANSPVPTPEGAGPEEQRSPPPPDRETWREVGAE
ncbi:PREDICTED: uncharacterized protein LOC106906853 isoform X1 [Poecilia mexicana]|uniref:uncharacterized protein LOC106906853 isoform X1 n=1 Tax=Poecilia mexicana TaxID=48701 RepID=UPI00072DB8A1|nr:PREDICTED: uncharacterized protein LOC106906853 isoform X1 [Poecilia mexicana]XP_014827791.1 PREDICTED: uncharacterized protein LOC106906853 isoform X1 [Poecilia mexicana]XP_014827793.1 PREDICTED: uncharacterized protein LOC106906853 isoform X1 [Poecilia mexicana]